MIRIGIIIGSTALLTRFGAMPPRTDYAEVMARIWHHAETRLTAAS